ncbi:hypothetical protein [Mammaliicoccus sp. I-M35]|uniref:hypothetical protein n=1 Tax=Mammaliicoccus sp. I-M35 TaxID=2898694 RepID=UPI001EFBBF52|nr:hypothetical protein [Mammaliicoccus sp. I-M35]
MIRLKKYEMILDTYMPLKDAAEVFQKIAERKRTTKTTTHKKRKRIKTLEELIRKRR